MKLLVCGGRDFTDAMILNALLDGFHAEVSSWNGHMSILNGAAAGADSLARQWAIDTGIPYEDVPANWREHGKAAGPIRNQHMLDMGKPDIVLAFDGGRGTDDMVRRAVKAGVPTYRVTSCHLANREVTSDRVGATLHNSVDRQA